MSTLGSRLTAKRNAQFIGRQTEISAFEALLATDCSQPVLYLHGSGGIGKTAWSARCESLALLRGHPVQRIDARRIPANPQHIRSALAFDALGTAPNQPATVVMIDTFEMWKPMECWLHEELLPQLPLNCRLVIAGRQAPSAEWQLDPGWAELMQVLQLSEFSHLEAAQYLQQRKIAGTQAEQAIQFSHGNPLALAMATDSLLNQHELPSAKLASADATRQLVQRLTRESTQAEQRQALQLVAIAAEVTEPMLEQLLEQGCASTLYNWLCELSFMQSSGSGLYPHDLVRNLLLSELRERFPGRYQQLAKQIFEFEASELVKNPSLNWETAAPAAMRSFFALRALPIIQTFGDFSAPAEIYLDAAEAAELPLLIAAIEKHEGQQCREVFELWLQQQPEGLIVFRDAQRQCVGFSFNVDIHRASAELRQLDPKIRHLDEHFADSISEQEPYRCCRYWMHLEHYQQPGAVSMAVMNFCFAYLLTAENPAIMSLACNTRADYWPKFAELVEMRALPITQNSSTEEFSNQFVIDWREKNRLDWLARFIHRLTGSLGHASRVQTQPTTKRQSTSALDRQAFNSAAALALKHFHLTDKLQNSPLLKTALADTADNHADPIRALRDSIRHCNAVLGKTAKTELHSRVIHRAYFEPARSQQLAADALGMSYSSYRRYLNKARELLIAELWLLANH